MDTSEVTRQALALFDRHADMPRAELSVALAHLRRTAPEVCAALVALLDADERTHAFESPLKWFGARGHGQPADSGAVWPDGTRLGAWCVDHVIGLGGMGLVYAAHRADGLYEREVALKTVRAELASPQLLQAFGKERSHLAKLEHPAIVALLDAGISDDGQPWLAMQRVNGLPIDQWSDAHRIDLRGRMALLIEACDAISYAHAHGILHQDIKPTNLLVTGEGRVKLLDFGLSAMLAPQGEGGFTRIGVSSAYAAPEVFEGAPPSVAIDVYALGVLLYRLLCEGWPCKPGAVAGAPCDNWNAQPASAVALGGGDAIAVRRGLRDAHALSRALHGDLDAIALRCVHHDPIARYASVADLRTDLQAWLVRRPVAARNGGFAYHVSRFVRRNALAVATSATLLAASATGGTLALQQLQRARLEAENTEILSGLFEKSLGIATLSSRGIAPLGSQTLLDDAERQLRAAAGNDRPQFLARGLAALARAHLLRGDGARCERLLNESKSLGAGDPLQAARTNAVLAELSGLRGRPAQAERLAQDGLDAIAAVEGPDAALVRLDLLQQYARSRRAQGGSQAAIAILDQAVDSARSLDGKAAPVLAELLAQRGDAYADLNHVDEAEADLRAALALLDEHSPAIRNRVRRSLSETLLRQGSGTEAHQLAADSLISSLEIFGPRHPETGLAWVAIGKSWYFGKHDTRRTRIAFGIARGILDRQVGPGESGTGVMPEMPDVAVDTARVASAALQDRARGGRAVAGVGATTSGAAPSTRHERMQLQKARVPTVEVVLANMIRDGERQGLSIVYARDEYAAGLAYFQGLEQAERQPQAIEVASAEGPGDDQNQAIDPVMRAWLRNERAPSPQTADDSLPLDNGRGLSRKVRHYAERALPPAAKKPAEATPGIERR